MDLNTKLNLDFKKIVFICLSVIVLIMVSLGCYLYFFNDKTDVETLPPDRELVEEELVVEEEVEIEPEEQNHVVSKLFAYVTEVRDLCTRFEYKIQVGMGADATESFLKAGYNAVYFDLNNKVIISPADVKVGDSIIVYATGKYTVGNLDAEIIAKGDNSTYNYGVLTTVEKKSVTTNIWTLSSGVDRLYISENTTVIDAYTGKNIQNIGLMRIGDKVLYKGVLEQTDLGNLFRCTEVIVFSK